VNLLKLHKYLCVLTGDDPDEISSSGSEDNADIQSSDVEFNGTQPSLIFIVINHYAIMIINHYAINPFNGPFSGTTQVSWYQKGTSNTNSNVVRICDNFRQIQQIYRLVYIEFGISVHCIKLSFVIHHRPSFRTGVNKCTLYSYFLMSV